MQARGRRSIWVLGGSGGCMWEGQRAGPAARRVCHGLGAGGGLDWRRGLEGRSRGTCSRGQLKFLKDDLVLENSARSCRRVADPGALAVWGGEWVPPNRVVATAAQTQDSAAALVVAKSWPSWESLVSLPPGCDTQSEAQALLVVAESWPSW